jgi:hypothetical protein
MADLEFLKSVLRINSKSTLASFIQELGVDNFNSALSRLPGSDYSKVTGHIEDIRIKELVAGQPGHPDVGNMLRTADTKEQLRKKSA